jgi:aminoglycoside phosphotransferase (APT) family kinase protein
VSERLVDALVDLHAIDVTRDRLAALGKPAGVVHRQVGGWSERWQHSKMAELPEMDAVAGWLLQHLPPDRVPPSVVHGDFKLDNVMLSGAHFDRVVAVFDWAMTALGDPLVDVGILLAYWSSVVQGNRTGQTIARPGWFTREQILDRYARLSGRDLSGIRFYEIFALFKIAVVISRSSSASYAGRPTPRFAHFDRRVSSLARQAARCSRWDGLKTVAYQSA